jgi:DNA repair exonuclease SbcCD ATPase subunit
MKKFTKIMTANLMVFSLFSFSSNVFAEENNATLVTDKSVAPAEQQKPVKHIRGHFKEVREQVKQERQVMIAEKQEKRAAIKAKLEELKAIHQQNKELNQQIKFALQSAKERIKEEVRTEDGKVDREKLNEIKGKIEVLKGKIKEIRDFKQKNKDQFIKGAREAAKNKDYDAMVGHIESAKNSIAELISMKQELLTYINSL